MSVYSVIEIIGTSSTSWEEAAAEAIKTAGEHLRELRVAEVVEQDIHLDEGGAITYRTKLQLSYKYAPEHSRHSADAATGGTRPLRKTKPEGGEMPETRSTARRSRARSWTCSRKSQEAVVDAIKLWADAVQSITASIPTPNLPYSDKLPKPEGGPVRGGGLHVRPAGPLPPGLSDVARSSRGDRRQADRAHPHVRCHAFPLRIGQTITQMLEADLAVETEAVGRLRRGIEYMRSIANIASANIFEAILADEEQRIDYLETQLGLIGQLGEPLYLAQLVQQPSD